MNRAVSASVSVHTNQVRMLPLSGWVKRLFGIPLSHFEVKQPRDLWTLITQLIIPEFFCALETYSIYSMIPWEHRVPLSLRQGQWCKTSASVRFLHVQHNCLISIWKYSPDIKSHIDPPMITMASWHLQGDPGQGAHNAGINMYAKWTLVFTGTRSEFTAADEVLLGNRQKRMKKKKVTD
jgi:hypothetical protein